MKAATLSGAGSARSTTSRTRPSPTPETLASSAAFPVETPAFLLTMGGYNGTLAATRNLGETGIPVVMAESSKLARARWSRWVSAREPCPPPSRGGRAFVDRLLEIGRRNPGRVLYPTSDDTAFLFAKYDEELRSVYRTCLPPLEAIYALLNKNRLYALAREVGIYTPETWFPRSAAEVEELASTTNVPLLLKPQTQIQFASQMKGFYVQDARALPEMYQAFMAGVSYGPDVLRYDPEVAVPLLQSYHGEAVRRIYSIAGFVSDSGRIAARGALKVFQRPRKLGVGICFESAPVAPDLLDKVQRLCALVGYHGVFEVEFIEVQGRFLLIDFNPRFYGQMGFEIARGLPLARLVYESALGNLGWVEQTLAEDRGGAGYESSLYCHRLAFELSLLLSEMTGRMLPEECDEWRGWLTSKRTTTFDAILSGDDMLPGLFDMLNEMLSAIRHPRSYFRSLVADRS